MKRLWKNGCLLLMCILLSSCGFVKSEKQVFETIEDTLFFLFKTEDIAKANMDKEYYDYHLPFDVKRISSNPLSEQFRYGNETLVMNFRSIYFINQIFIFFLIRQFRQKFNITCFMKFFTLSIIILKFSSSLLYTIMLILFWFTISHHYLIYLFYYILPHKNTYFNKKQTGLPSAFCLSQALSNSSFGHINSVFSYCW